MAPLRLARWSSCSHHNRSIFKGKRGRILGVVILYEITFRTDTKEQPGRVRGIILGCAAIAAPLLVMLYQRAAVWLRRCR